MGKRIAAKVLDATFIFLLTGMALVPVLLLAEPFHIPDQSDLGISFLDAKWLLLIPIIMVAIPIGYETAFVAIRATTPGKRLFRLRVVSSSGAPINWKRSFARTVTQILSGTIAGIGYLMAFIDWEQRTLHDRICGTLVIGESKEHTDTAT